HWPRVVVTVQRRSCGLRNSFAVTELRDVVGAAAGVFSRVAIGKAGPKPPLARVARTWHLVLPTAFVEPGGGMGDVLALTLVALGLQALALDRGQHLHQQGGINRAL